MRSSRLIAVFAGLIVLAIFVAHFVYFWPQINDDAFITLRYSKFLAMGRGPYFNVGEHVEGYTNFLLMLIMAGWIALFGDAQALAAAKIIGLLGGLATLVFTWALCAAWLRKIPPLAQHAPALAWLAPAFVALNSGFALNSTTGLETTLFAAWIALGLWLAQRAEDRQKWCGAGIAFALAALTRPEGAVVFAVVVVGRVLAGPRQDVNLWRRLGWDGLAVGAAVSAHLAFRWSFYDGEWLPNTYYAKLGGLGGRRYAAAYLGQFLREYFAYVGWLPALAPLFSLSPALRRSTLTATAVMGWGAFAVFITGPDWMLGSRLLVPFLPAFGALSVVGLASVLVERVRLPRPSVTAAACLLLIVGLAVWQHPMRQTEREWCLTRARGYQNGHEALARWLRDHCDPGDTVALMDIGIVGFRNPELRIFDIVGLTDRTVAKSPGGFQGKEFDAAYLFDRRPRYMVIVWGAHPGLDALTSLDSLEPWTSVEFRLVEVPDFMRNYYHPREVDPTASRNEILAARLGAARVFEHDLPNRLYLLVVHEFGPPDSPGE